MTEAAQAQGQAAPESADIQPEQGQQAEERSYSQADLNKIAANEKREGKQSGATEREQQILEELGAESLDDLKGTVEAYHSAVTELEGEEIADLKKQHKETLKTVQTDLDAHKEALQGYLDKEREGLQEHVTELLDTMSAPDQLAYITKHGDALRAEPKPQTIGRGSSPGGGTSASQAEVTPGIGRLKVAYSKRN